ncbi:MAG: bifunctional metallophosphatase/5'-nucleotidase [Prevotellaceae bacterium]|jgi:2',3'-cyclic-nucleotide 2'-phosphodiesterase/3'-nucleotidase|nr:bifunctional metallophosphatase/5'-nucleotidase [Prevotellaceae bacterium]
MNKTFPALLLSLFLLAGCTPQRTDIELVIIETSDIHGNFYSDPEIGNENIPGNLAKACSYIMQQRKKYGDDLLLMDNGDILQGQPITYYYNYVDTTSVHLAADMLNYMGYNVGNVGNHDIETGEKVFDRWSKDCSFPVLGANVIDTLTGQPHFTPYTVLKRNGIKIVVLGMVTPAIPIWVPEDKWQGLRFEDIEEAARKWIPVIRQKENPDIVIGLLHTGANAYTVDRRYRENSAVEMAERVPGFDAVLLGHDHLQLCKKVANANGDSVFVINPGNNGEAVAQIHIKLKLKEGNIISKEITGHIEETKTYPEDKDFQAYFARQRQRVRNYVQTKIGRISKTISTRDAYFGPNAFVSLIHMIQMEVCKADISLASPLSYNTEIRQGDVTMGDIFRFYTFENQLYTIEMYGREIRDELEMSYNLWTNRMLSPDEHLLLLREQPLDGTSERSFFVNYTSNFDSAAGLFYTVDVTRPMGNKVHITGLTNGQPFDLNRIYRVAVNSYRGNGGGEMLIKGGGIPSEELKQRIVFKSPHDFRYYLRKHFQRSKEITPRVLGTWHFEPRKWAEEAAKRDYEYLFGSKE